MYGLKKVGKNRYRESAGAYYEDFNVGDVFEHRPGRTISEADNTWFTLLTMNTHPIHFDHAYAAKSDFRQPLINSALTLAIVTGMSVTTTSQKSIANLGWTDITLPAPVFAGDTIYAETEILDKRESKSRKDNGIITVETSGLKADSTVVLNMKRSFMVARIGSAVDDRSGY